MPGISRLRVAILVSSIAILSGLAFFGFLNSAGEGYGGLERLLPALESPDSSDSGSGENIVANALRRPRIEVSSGWTVTSYQDANEAVYEGRKIEVFDSGGKSLGFYKSDFLEQVKIDGSGKGDGIRNSGKYLHYDYEADDGKTYYLSDKSLGAYGNEIVPWNGTRPSIAVNPPLPEGTKIRFKDLGPLGNDNPRWVIALLKTKTFYADDKFFGVSGKKLDVYVGLQKTKDPSGAPESLWMTNVTVYIERR